ncbi:glycoside hydrolase family 97 protein [Pedobacter sp. MC2016-14]|uniref:glycoside hydrolase family 97 protein n=1 Tax=Pedobacter sp. MC2016-14 TaxID=2897327 RepID=UPI001E2A4EA4|nr:glycoside hydrolase family 97 protein [Pedobacter sp. MC2016-14]MCD0488275.1 glycoside hydrolase family 97 protein [Pedobacter sp. MC2016-14]
MKTIKMIFGMLIATLCTTQALGQVAKNYVFTSPDKKITVTVSAGKELQWSVDHAGTVVILPSTVSLQLQNQVLGSDVKVTKASQQEVNHIIKTNLYKKAEVKDQYHELLLDCKGGYQVQFRAYNQGVAYRFLLNTKDSVTILSEQSSYVFAENRTGYLPFIDPKRSAGDKYQTSFENTYTYLPLANTVKDSLAFLPVLIELADGKKAVITEADLEDYPGMYLKRGSSPQSLTSELAPYPKTEKRGGYNNVQSVVTGRENYIAKTSGKRPLPWRVIAVSKQDKDLLDNDLVYNLAAPSRVSDESWIKPGKVAWDWWNDWNISKVDFRAGINTTTYKYYIDFAAANKLEYIMLDEGWSEKADIMKVIPDLNLKEIIDYGRKKNVGVWLWAGMYTLNEKMKEAYEHYSKMGVKGFKIDFINRDDQKMVNFYYKAARMAAERKLLVDFHGAYKPTGLMRTYPNILNFEGVFGIESFKALRKEVDFPGYETLVPYIRMLAGPLDHTPGAMRNATKKQYFTVNSMPMSQGTRCHQIALYVTYEAPLNMLSDNPTVYMKEQETTDFIASVPTVFDATVALDGKVGEYTVLARRKGNTWFVAALNNWNARDIEVDLSALGKIPSGAVIMQDGINADRDATDYKKLTLKIPANNKLKIHMAPGGGWAARLN